MNFERYTEALRGVLAAAQTLAMREKHQLLMPAHVLRALLDAEDGFVNNLIRDAGGIRAYERKMD